MDKTELHSIEELAKQARLHYITTRTEILDYLDDNMCQMGEAELKMCVALFIEGRPLNAGEFSIITALHANTIRQHLFSRHVQAINEIIIDQQIKEDEMIEDNNND